MRIRTVKPEFWTHPVVGRLSDRAKWLAVALLNYADDEGYFLAETASVRGAIAPYVDDLATIHGALMECSRAGWIEVSAHAEHGQIGRIVNFAKHQIINRPSASRLKRYWVSLNTHGVLTEPSMPEQGTGNREQGMEQGMEQGEECAEPALTRRSPPAPTIIPKELSDLDLYRSDDRLCRHWSRLMTAFLAAYPRGREWIEAEIRKAHAWEVANPTRRKKDRARFIDSWLRRAQDSGSVGAGSGLRTDWLPRNECGQPLIDAKGNVTPAGVRRFGEELARKGL